MLLLSAPVARWVVCANYFGILFALVLFVKHIITSFGTYCNRKMQFFLSLCILHKKVTIFCAICIRPYNHRFLCVFACLHSKAIYIVRTVIYGVVLSPAFEMSPYDLNRIRHGKWLCVGYCIMLRIRHSQILYATTI